MRGRLTSWPAMKTASSIWAFLSLDIFLPLDLFFSYTVLSLFKDFEYSLEDCVLYYFVAAPSFVICVGPQHLLGKTVHSPWILGPKFLNGTSPGSALRPESCFSCYPTLKLPIVLACALRHIRLHALLIRILWAFWWQKTAQKMVAKMLFCSPCFILFRDCVSWVPTLKMKVKILVTKCGVDFGVEKAGEQTLEVIGSINALFISGNKHDFVWHTWLLLPLTVPGW